MADNVTNEPSLWLGRLPVPTHDGHKYDRGHAVVVGAPELTGATRLAASACSRIGAGLVSVMAEKRADVYRTSLPADIMVTSDLERDLRSVTAVLIGPGGLPDRWETALSSIAETATVILDAAALVEHERIGERFENRVLTPHEGEFAATFPELSGDRVERAQAAAASCGSVVVLKGAETVIVDPEGQVVINTTASPYLAKGGSGDVLAGMVTGLSAQGMSPFEASCAGVWMHGEIARRFGPGLVPEDLTNRLPGMLTELLIR